MRHVMNEQEANRPFSTSTFQTVAIWPIFGVACSLYEVCSALAFWKPAKRLTVGCFFMKRYTSIWGTDHSVQWKWSNISGFYWTRFLSERRKRDFSNTTKTIFRNFAFFEGFKLVRRGTRKKSSDLPPLWRAELWVVFSLIVAFWAYCGSWMRLREGATVHLTAAFVLDSNKYIVRQN